MSLNIMMDVGPAPQSGTEKLEVSAPATQAEFQTQAAEAISSKGNFLQVTLVVPPGSTASAEKVLINVTKVRSVV